MHYKIFSSVLCFFVTSSLFCAEGSQEIIAARPVIRAKIYIYDGYKTAYYMGENYHEELTQMGIPSCIQNPLIPVIIQRLDRKKRIVDLTREVHIRIKKFECAQYKAQGIEMNEDIMSEVFQKKLPGLIPAIYLYGATTGTILSFTIHNYPVQLTCCNNKVTKKAFKKDFDSRMAAFIGQPSGFYYFVDPMPKLLEHELVKVQGEEERLFHGKKGFVSMEKLMRELMGKNAEIILLLWPFCSKKI